MLAPLEHTGANAKRDECEISRSRGGAGTSPGRCSTRRRFQEASCRSFDQVHAHTGARSLRRVTTSSLHRRAVGACVSSTVGCLSRLYDCDLFDLQGIVELRTPNSETRPS
ncbi:hypothetical protein MRX96_019542 [Rhipicephalus microplus]